MDDSERLTEIAALLRKKRDFHEEEADRYQKLLIELGFVPPIPDEEVAEIERQTPSPKVRPAKKATRQKRRTFEEIRDAITSLMADGPTSIEEVFDATGISRGAIRNCLANGPFEKSDPKDRFSKWQSKR